MTEERKTMRVDPSFLDGKEPLAVGYKIFEYDGGANGDYCYCDESNVMEGSVHTVTGPLQKCGWGLQFCRNPLDCLCYQDPVTWNRFAQVEAYDEMIEHEGDDKSVARTLKIVKELTFNEFISAVRYSSGVSSSSGVRSSSGVSYSSGVSDSAGVSDSLFSANLKGAYLCVLCNGIVGAAYRLFNKDVGPDRVSDVLHKLRAFHWAPMFNNAKDLRRSYGNEEWSKTPADMIKGKTNKEAYADMPQAMVDYIKTLPEYDADIFQAITGRDDA